MDGCRNQATHKIFTVYGEFLICEGCIDHTPHRKVVKMTKDWTLARRPVTCQCENVIHDK